VFGLEYKSFSYFTSMELKGPHGYYPGRDSRIQLDSDSRI